MFRRTVPVLRMFDVEATTRFYVDYLGFTLDWCEGDDGGPVFMQVSREDVRISLSSHHGDGTPGAVVIVVVDDASALHAELHSRDYPFMDPGIEARGVGKEVTVLDPASNQIRFF